MRQTLVSVKYCVKGWQISTATGATVSFSLGDSLLNPAVPVVMKMKKGVTTSEENPKLIVNRPAVCIPESGYYIGGCSLYIIGTSTGSAASCQASVPYQRCQQQNPENPLLSFMLISHRHSSAP